MIGRFAALFGILSSGIAPQHASDASGLQTPDEVPDKVDWPVNSNARTREKAKETSKSRIPNFPVNLSGLVLFCIDTSDSESRRIFQHFSRSTRLSHLCTAPVLIFALFCSVR